MTPLVRAAVFGVIAMAVAMAGIAGWPITDGCARALLMITAVIPLGVVFRSLAPKWTDPPEPATPPLFLYLRPFSTESDLRVEMTDTYSFGEVDRRRYFGSSLQKLLAPFGRTELIGGGKIDPNAEASTTDTQWFSRFEKLAEEAAVIFCIPAASTGCMLEIQWLIRNRVLDKCVFIRPPSEKNLDPEWERARKAWADAGLQLPQVRGLTLFRVRPDGSSGESQSAEFFRTDTSLRRALLSLMPRDRLGLPPLGHESEVMSHEPVTIGAPLYSPSWSIVYGVLTPVICIAFLIAMVNDFTRLALALTVPAVFAPALAWLIAAQPRSIRFGARIDVVASPAAIAEWSDITAVRISGDIVRFEIDDRTFDLRITPEERKTLEDVLRKTGRSSLIRS